MQCIPRSFVTWCGAMQDLLDKAMQIAEQGGRAEYSVYFAARLGEHRRVADLLPLVAQHCSETANLMECCNALWGAAVASKDKRLDSQALTAFQRQVRRLLSVWRKDKERRRPSGVVKSESMCTDRTAEVWIKSENVEAEAQRGGLGKSSGPDGRQEDRLFGSANEGVTVPSCVQDEQGMLLRSDSAARCEVESIGVDLSDREGRSSVYMTSQTQQDNGMEVNMSSGSLPHPTRLNSHDAASVLNGDALYAIRDENDFDPAWYLPSPFAAAEGLSDESVLPEELGKSRCGDGSEEKAWRGEQGEGKRLADEQLRVGHIDSWNVNVHQHQRAVGYDRVPVADGDELHGQMNGEDAKNSHKSSHRHRELERTLPALHPASVANEDGSVYSMQPREIGKATSGHKSTRRWRWHQTADKHNVAQDIKTRPWLLPNIVWSIARLHNMGYPMVPGIISFVVDSIECASGASAAPHGCMACF